MTRIAASASACLLALCAAFAFALPATAGAAASGPHQLSLNVVPNPSQAGDPIVITGRLTAPDRAHRVVVLWRRFTLSRGFKAVQRTRTDAHGRYVFTRSDGVQVSRSYFVVAGRNQSRTVFEGVHALVSMQAPTGDAVTNHVLTFAGQVQPGRAGRQVVLQRQLDAAGTRWRTITRATGRTKGDGTFSIPVRFRLPDTYTIRARFVGDRRNLGGASDSVDVVVAQTQNPKLTLQSMADPITIGQAATLTGTLAGQGAGHAITLLAHEAGQGFQPVASAVTAADGSFSFTQVPPHTTVYRVESDTGAHSAQVFEAVRRDLTASADRTTATSGQPVTFSGTVTPGQAGLAVLLQHLGHDGRWHTVMTGTLTPSSTYALTYVVQSPRTQVFRVRVDGTPVNWGAASAPIAIAVSPPAA